jgi:endonuclease YncB( thermonuclease family)
LLAAPARAADTATVRHVLDGDSLVLADGRELRLIGVNAPETGRDGRPDQPLARAARTLLASLLEGQRVTLTFETERRDRYQRLLAHARLPDGRDPADILLRQGLAWLVAIPPNVAHATGRAAIEAEARAAARGVWGEAAYAPVPAERLGDTDTGFRFVSGRVQALREGRETYYLELAPRVALAIPRADWDRYFAGTAPHYGHPRRLVGRRVVARGWLAPGPRGLRLRAAHPLMLTWSD